ncbi:hypothetical protein FHR75_002562 [Kineococcus radiotolerans]|uniref:MmyB-like transcription regulator ligand binding domain-containing protein n=1 Tax=Kineococcus radiotolerans TaxID=131568 RepID=A0A7W4TMS4_KINRA|nr:hypothetical protein [Kineococcus radiotolerans]MBB2901747.1 hypothetical protein [Kineococcus radiotolerans]
MPDEADPPRDRAGEDAWPAGTGPDAEHLQQVVESLQEVPAVLRTRHLDVLASNRLARRLSAAFEPGVNLGRYTFLNPVVPTFTDDWGRVSGVVASSLRTSLETHLEDPGFRSLVGELSARSDDFSRAWARPSLPDPSAGRLDWDHPVVGRMRLAFQDLSPGYERDGVVLTLWRPVGAESARRLDRLRTMGIPAAPPPR